MHEFYAMTVYKFHKFLDVGDVKVKLSHIKWNLKINPKEWMNAWIYFKHHT